MKLVEEDLTGRVFAHGKRKTTNGNQPFFGADRRMGPRRSKTDRRSAIRFEAERRVNAGRRKDDFDMRAYQTDLTLL